MTRGHAVGVPLFVVLAPLVATLLDDPKALAVWLRDHDPIIDAARARRSAADAATAQARVLPNPTLSVALGGIPLGRGNRSDDMTGPTSLTSVSNVAVGVSELFEIGKRGPRAAAADARARGVRAALTATLGDRIGDATAKLGNLAYLTARRDAVAANLAAAQRLRDLEKTRLDKQDLSEAEFLRIQLDTDAIDVQLQRATAELAAATAECSATLRAPCATDGIAASLLDSGAPLPAALPALDRAIDGRPIHEVARSEATAARWDAKLAENRAIPDLTVGVGYTFDNYEYSGSIPQTLVVSVGIPLPLFDRGAHDAAAARATAAAAEAEDRATVIESRGIVDTLVGRRDALQRVLDQLDTVSLPASTKIIAQTRQSFDLGQVRLADLLLVERSHRDLLLEVLDTRFELFGVRAQLRHELGLDDELARGIP